MGYRSQCIRGLLRNDRDHFLFFPCRGESGSGAHELGDFNYGRRHLLRGCILCHVREESVSGACGRGCAVPDLIELECQRTLPLEALNPASTFSLPILQEKFEGLLYVEN